LLVTYVFAYCLSNILNSKLIVICNKKSELMLTRCTRAYSSSCSQVILVYVHPFSCSSLFCNLKLPKNHYKPLFLGFKVNQGHQCWQSLSPVLVMLSSMSVPICNHFHTSQANRISGYLHVYEDIQTEATDISHWSAYIFLSVVCLSVNPYVCVL